MSSVWRVVINLWESTQVELHGLCSEERVLQLTKYANEASWLRVIAVLFVTPLPCLFVTVAVDLLPLADPSEGVSANFMFFIRTFFTIFVVTTLVVLQFRVSVPILPYPLKRVFGGATLVSLCIVGILDRIAQIVGFPVPFGLLMVTPPWTATISFIMAFELAKRVRETPGAAVMLINSFKLWACQLLLVFAYPPYFYIFTTLSKSGKTAFALLLPVIKMFMRNILARTVTHLHDEMPEVVVFNCDTFNALFVSYCMQNSPSIWITLEIMFFDVVMMVFSLRDARSNRRYLRDLELRMLQQRSSEGIQRIRSRAFSGNITTLQRASVLLGNNSKTKVSTATTALSQRQVAPSPALVDGVAGMPSFKGATQKVVVLPKSTDNAFALAGNPSPVATARAPLLQAEHAVCDFSRLQSHYIRKVQRVVYAAEFLLLLNYVDVVIPLVFCNYIIRCIAAKPGTLSYSPTRVRIRKAIRRGADQARVLGLLQRASIVTAQWIRLHI